MTPIGIPTEVVSMSDRLTKRFARSHTRKDLVELTTGMPRRQWPEWVTEALEAARLAPSAANRQPWRFHVASDSITLSLDDGKLETYRISKLIDMGIAMLHVETGARHAGVSGIWEYLELPAVARFTRQ